MTLRLAAAVALLAALSACNALPDDYQPKPKKAQPTARATPIAEPSPVPTMPADNSARLAAARAVVPATLDSYVFDGDDKLIDAPFGPVLLRHGHNPDAGHSEPGVIAAYYLRAEGERFVLVNSYPDAAVSGSFGNLTRWSVSGAFTDLPVVVVEGGGTWQGCTVGLTDLIELRPIGPAVIASITTTFDPSGMTEDGGEAYTGTITDVRRDRGFTVRYKGTDSFAERYVRRGNRFVIEGGESRITGC
ncbi:hypothetical protein LQ953_10990 [Sphingomonas sp. IC-56]|uniref:hypothetical protein n=1 Tax=Sphingomonas sp. IC-56 TaxID=2898529 RepID=UPI001E5149A1|nr:hypothetical protein [Sphingomonas sp. IC-56]MCD2324539.1 hypothetical protein [Sphingomonas sp. IC-56]